MNSLKIFAANVMPFFAVTASNIQHASSATRKYVKTIALSVLYAIEDHAKIRTAFLISRYVNLVNPPTAKNTLIHIESLIRLILTKLVALAKFVNYPTS
jgi:hypothetical protein